MPIYEYACTGCGHELETLQKMNDPPLVECPACGDNTLKKKISAAGFRLKGSGWYETDFKNKKPSTPSEKTDTSKPSDKPEKTDTSSSDTSSTTATAATS